MTGRRGGGVSLGGGLGRLASPRLVESPIVGRGRAATASSIKLLLRHTVWNSGEKAGLLRHVDPSAVVTPWLVSRSLLCSAPRAGVVRHAEHR